MNAYIDFMEAMGCYVMKIPIMAFIDNLHIQQLARYLIGPMPFVVVYRKCNFDIGYNSSCFWVICVVALIRFHI